MSRTVLPRAASNSSAVGLFIIVLLFIPAASRGQIVVPGAQRRAIFTNDPILPAGTRAEGMSAAIAVADDSSAPASNPAGLALLARAEVSIEYDRMTMEIETPPVTLTAPGRTQTIEGTGSGDYSHVGYAAVALTSRVANFAFTYRKLSTFPELETILIGDRNGEAYSAASSLIPGGDIYNFGFTVAKSFGKVSVGASVNQIEADPTSTFTINDSGASFGESSIREFSKTYFDAGLLVRFGPASIGAVYRSDDETLPAQFGAGIAYRPSDRITLAADYGESRVAAGGEFVIVIANELRLPLRAGYFTEERDSLYGEDDAADYNGWSIGGGMHFGVVRIDLGYISAGATERAGAGSGEVFEPAEGVYVPVIVSQRACEVSTARVILGLAVRF